MPYMVMNQTKDTKPYRDDAGKHFLPSGVTVSVVGDQHAPALEAQGFEVTFVQSHRDIIATAAAEDAVADAKADDSDAKPGRKATVTVKDR